MKISFGDKRNSVDLSMLNRINDSSYGPLVLLPVGLLALTFLFPLLAVIYSSFFGPIYQLPDLNFDGYTFLYNNYFGVLLHTVWFAVVTTVLTCLLSLPIAFYIRDAGKKEQVISMLILIVPLMVNIIVRNFGWIELLSSNGIINQWLLSTGIIGQPLQLVRNSTGVYIGLVHVYIPFMALPIYNVLNSMDPSLQEAARVHGATRTKSFLYVTLPNLLPGIIAGSTIVFVLTLGVYVTPVIMGGNLVVTLPMAIRQFTANVLNWRFATASATVLLVIAIAVILLMNYVSQRVSGQGIQESRL